jgi:dienelactone hydrolase
MSSVLLLHAWWGRTPLFIMLRQRFAEAGFQVEVPDPYGNGQMAQSVEEAEALSDSLEDEGTQHGFAESDRPEYDAAAADSAWARTMELLRREL